MCMLALDPDRCKPVCLVVPRAHLVLYRCADNSHAVAQIPPRNDLVHHLTSGKKRLQGCTVPGVVSSLSREMLEIPAAVPLCENP